MHLEKSIKEGHYKYQHAYGGDETGYFRKECQLGHLCVGNKNASGFNATKNCMALIFGGNANGESKCK